MSIARINSEAANTFKDEASEENNERKIVKIELNEDDRIVPVVVFELHEPVAEFDDVWREGIGVHVQPITNVVRVHIRPDVPKKEAKKYLRKLIALIDKDEYDWMEETDNFLENWRAQTVKSNRGKSKG